MANRVKIPPNVFRAISAVRDSGLSNMFDLRVVIRIANALGFVDEIQWLKEPANSSIYAEGILWGFEPGEY